MKNPHFVYECAHCRHTFVSDRENPKCRKCKQEIAYWHPTEIMSNDKAATHFLQASQAIKMIRTVVAKGISVMVKRSPSA
jgi:DNA-directed RNA polymerase subunit RPC12/RpoP